MHTHHPLQLHHGACVDCVLDGFFQDRHTAVRLSPNATGTFHRVTFSNSRTAAAPAAAGPALGLRTTLDDEAVLQRAAAWLRDCVFFNNTSPNPPPVSQQAESRVYVSELSAAPGAVWDETSRVVALPWVLRAYSEPELQPPAPATSVLFDVAAEGFIYGGEPWLRGAIRVRLRLPPLRLQGHCNHCRAPLPLPAADFQRSSFRKAQLHNMQAKLTLAHLRLAKHLKSHVLECHHGLRRCALCIWGRVGSASIEVWCCDLV